MRKQLPFLFLLLPFSVFAQGGQKAASCFWGSDFELGIPLDWTITQVERQTSAGVGLSEFVPAFTIGTAEDANAGGFFPVLDAPIGNQFIMANDDASPCNCNMSEVSLTTGPIDLTGRTGLALEFRAFHEMTLGAGDAIVEASMNGTDWSLLDTLYAVTGAWQDVFIALDDYDNAPLFQLRFRWSDGGTWSSGFAMDDLCLRERSANDVSIVRISACNTTVSPFDLPTRSMCYTMLPLEQAAASTVTVEVRNRGTQTMTGLHVQGEAILDGTSLGTVVGTELVDLAPGERDTLVLTGLATPTSVGDLELSATVVANETDDDISDNTASAFVRITGMGWDDGYSAMGLDGGTPEGNFMSTSNFIAANRLEVVNSGSHAHGVGVFLEPTSQLGEVVRAILMDGNFAFIDTTLRDTIDQADLDLAWGAGAMYLPFVTPPELPVGDYFVGFQRLTGTGNVGIRTSGNGPTGASAMLVGLPFNITWSTATPMVRLHLTPLGVGIAKPTHGESSLHVFPVPMSGLARIEFQLDKAARVEHSLLDMTGRVVQTTIHGILPAGENVLTMDASVVPAGGYILRLAIGDSIRNQFICVER